MNKIGRYKFSLFLFLLSVLSLVLFVHNSNASSDALLEISVSLVEDDSFIPGDSFHAIVEIRNRDAQGRMDVLVSYDILDSNGDAVLSDSKTVAVETKTSFAEEFNLPAWIDEGTYFLRANVSSLNSSKWSEATRSFQVVVVSEAEQRVVEYVLIIGLVCTGGALVYEHRRISKLKVSDKELKKFIEERKK